MSGLTVALLGFCAALVAGSRASRGSLPEPTAALVETLPLQDTIPQIPGTLSTASALIDLVDGASGTLDFTAMYWALVAEPSTCANVSSGDCPDDSGFTAEQLEGFGCGAGRDLYTAIQDAAARGVRIRIVQSPGLGGGTAEADALAKNFTNVELATVDMGDWYGSGIMHQKLWVADGLHGYVGSANMDWKSLAQVKELGIAFRDAPDMAQLVQTHFDMWWAFSNLPNVTTTSVFDTKYNVQRTVPCWSYLVDGGARCQNPLQRAMPTTPQASFDSQLVTSINGSSGGLFLSCSPPETCIDGRTDDETGLVRTILDAKEWVKISVMDFVPASLYTDVPIYWQSLFNAIVLAINTTPGLRVQILASLWAHTSSIMGPYLEALQATSEACTMADYPPQCNGTIEIQYYVIPGWNSTEDYGQRKFPGHTRVNHAKYIVTDRRANIGTSNMVWGYFHNTAGASLNLNHTGFVNQLNAVFDRDWESNFTVPL